MSRVQSIERAFAVLAALSNGPLGVTELAERVGLPKSTVARLLASLVREEAVEQVPGETRYRIGTRLVDLVGPARPTRSIVAVARPELARLAAELGEATGLAVADGDAVRYVDQVDSANPVQVRDWTGTRVPMHAVPSGQVILAALPEAALERFLARPLERFTAHTLTDPGALRERLGQVRRDGYAWVRDEYAEGISSVAAAIADQDGALSAALHVHGPSYRFPRPDSREAVARSVVAAAARVSGSLRRPPAG